jgi:hypothetical protein
LSSRRALRALFWLALWIPAVARGLETPDVPEQPASSDEAYGGFQRKLLRLGNAAGSLAAIGVTETDQLQVSVSNDEGATWTAFMVGNGPFASVTVYAWSAVVDPETHRLHIAFSADASGAIGNVGYAVGAYAPSPADPTFSWTITADAIGPLADLRYDVMALAWVSVGGTTYLDFVCGRSESLDGPRGRMRWSFRRATPGLGEWWTVPGGLGRTPDGAGEHAGTIRPRPGPTPSLIEDDANWWWPEEWDTGGHYYVLRIEGASSSTTVEDADGPAGPHDLIVPAGTALTFTPRYRVSRTAAALMERREPEVKSVEALCALAAAEAFETARGGMEQLVASGGGRLVPSDAAIMNGEMSVAEEHLQAGRYRSSGEHSKIVLDRLAAATRKVAATRRQDLLAYVKVLAAGFDMMQAPGRNPGPDAERIIADGRRVLADAQAALATGDLEAAETLVRTGAELLRKAHAGSGNPSASEEPLRR